MVISTDFLSLLNRFSLIVRKKVTSSYSGSRRSSAVGRGAMIRDYRPYASGDDFRLIDWKLFARTDNLYIKRFEEDRSATLHVIVDASKSMDFSSKKITKFEYAAMIGVGFAYLGLRENEKFQFATFSQEIETFSPRRGMHQLVAMVDYLNKMKLKGEASFAKGMSQYKKLIGSKAIVVILSDFLIDLDEIKEAISQFQNHEIIMIQVLDPLERELSYEGDVKLKDLETQGMMETFVGPSLRSTYLSKLAEHNSKLEKIALDLRASFFSVTTSSPLFDSFFEILLSPKRGS